ncbi:lymphocyte antigen 6H-like [Monodelphis domestica]|uniref:lymphocyte antigen 6H-like n=1 Tax=Monodelphis domestica TaxID=13616 RepID=UPI00028BE6A3|nr:lymphocyte antigen 6H-like [Monodelphis domestica]
MRILLPVLLSTLLCVGPAYSINCYNCTGVKQFSQCNTTQCPGLTYCESLEAEDKNGQADKKIYFKGCTNSCGIFFKELLEKAHSQISTNLIEVDYSCCSKELCNGADGISGSPLALIGTLLLSLGPAILWAGL